MIDTGLISHQPVSSRGVIIAIGGAEQKQGKMCILLRFIRLCGAENAHITVIPSASEKPSPGEEYRDIFLGLGAAQVDILPISRRKDCYNPAYTRLLEQATGIFITGGEPYRLSSILAGTPLAHTLKQRNVAGTPVAGTSAGATFMAKHMIEQGNNNCGPDMADTLITPGLGLIGSVVIDQHFSERQRLGRLLSATMQSSSSFGLGLDENTAAVISPNMIIAVIGSGSVTVLNTTGMSVAAQQATINNSSLEPPNLRVEILEAGGQYDLNKGRRC